MSAIEVLRAAGLEAATVFDVGANIGSTVKVWRGAFPRARIVAFEPVPGTFARLAQCAVSDRRLEVHQTALGNQVGHVRMRAVPSGLCNKILKDDAEAEAVEVVPITTGDAFCRQRRIDRIDFMKIDAEGHDLDVLRGFEGLLDRRAIKYLQIECGVSRDNHLHVPLWDLTAYLGSKGYGLVEICDPVRRNLMKKTHQRGIFYCNAIFAAEEFTARELRLQDQARRIGIRTVRLKERAAAAADLQQKGL